MRFKTLHNQDKPLIIGNIWDVPSAKVAEKLNFQAIGTSSAAIATLLGYQDGEEMKFSELEYFVKQIALNTNLPLSVDLESGYSRNPIEIANHINRLANLGIAGINIEDSIVQNDRSLLNAEEFAQNLSKVNEILHNKNIDIFLNVRTDTFFLGHPSVIEETKKRIILYESAGANGIFIPCIEDISDIKEIVKCTDLPINVMFMPNLPDFDTLSELGVKRISMSNFLFDNMYSQFENTMKKVIGQKSFKSIF